MFARKLSITVQIVRNKKQAIQTGTFAIALALCASSWISSPLALAGGFLVAHFVGHPCTHLNHKATSLLLKIAVVGLGFGMHIDSALNAGKEGMSLSVISIVTILLIGFIAGKLLKIDLKTAHLLSSGTAICGGSAIAAVAPAINASEKEISVSLATVFILNALALFSFPVIGHFIGLSQYQFGLWSAIAIHDTSSVVGAAATFGAEALEVATTVKMVRALWIFPVVLFSAYLFKSNRKKVSIPWFIGFFILAMLANSYIPLISIISTPIVAVSKSVLVMTLFLIGAGLSVEKIKAVGWRPFALGVLLWVFISATSLLAILHL
jgi:uncharacterized integral membrane protein (TIGR00698 family)